MEKVYQKRVEEGKRGRGEEGRDRDQTLVIGDQLSVIRENQEKID